MQVMSEINYEPLNCSIRTAKYSFSRYGPSSRTMMQSNLSFETLPLDTCQDGKKETLLAMFSTTLRDEINQIWRNPQKAMDPADQLVGKAVQIL